MMFGSNNAPDGNSPGKSGAVAQPLPPLPDLNTKGSGNSQATPTDPFQATMMAIKPVQDAVNAITSAVQSIARTGLIPGGGPLDQIVQLASSLLPLAAQSMMKPGGLTGMPPPPNGPDTGMPGGGGGAPPPGPPPPVQ